MTGGARYIGSREINAHVRLPKRSRVRQRPRVVRATPKKKKRNNETKAVKLPMLLEGEALASWLELCADTPRQKTNYWQR